MIPATLRAPPTGITDAGYKVWLGIFVFWERARLACWRLRLLIANLKLHLAQASRKWATTSERAGSRSCGDNKPAFQRWEPLAPKARRSSGSLGHRPRNSDHHVKQELKARFNLVGGRTGAGRESRFQRLWVFSFHKHWGIAPGWR